MPGILCEHCTGVCCKYIALPIEEPESDSDFEDVRWYLLHEGVSIFIEDGDWYINVTTTCRHLQPDNRCGIYETRPKICRTYSTDNCDYHSGDYGWEAHFTCPEHLDAWRKRQAAAERNGAAKKGAKKKTRGKLKARLRNRVQDERAARREAAPPRERVPLLDRDIHGVPLPVLRLPRT